MTWGDRVTFEVSSANPDDTPVWVDLTSRVLHGGGLELNTGRQDNLDQAQPSSLRFTLRNDDDRFTYGNPSSPYAAWWGPGRKCRLRETYGSAVVDLFTGYLQVPQETQPDAKSGSQQVTVSAIDRLGRLAAAPTFLSTLASYILLDPPDTLSRYWPPVGGSTTFTDLVGSKTLTALKDAGGQATFTAADGPVAAADDFDAPNFVPGTDDISTYYLLSTDLSLAFTANQALTIVAWILPTATNELSTDLINASILENAGSSALVVYETAAQLVANINFGALTGTINSGLKLPVDVPTPIAIQYGYSPSLFEFWVGRNRLTGTLSGSPPTSSSVIQLILWERFQGRIGHIQLHVGNAFTFTEFQAQADIGTFALERQTTGERIRTIAAYAGIPLAEYTDTVDKGTAIMQAASLADKTPLEAMREAERTEQGLLYVDGSGRLVFKDRRSLYNV